MLLDRFLGQSKAAVKREQGLRLVEGVSGVWHYHLAYGPDMKALCDPTKIVMSTGAPLDSWGYRPSHIPHSYCRQCEQIAVARKLGLPEAVRRA